MGIKIQPPEQYETALRKLFPRGTYWDRQFADPESDSALFCTAKTGELVWFRNRMSDLQNESAILSASETIEDWERVFAETANAGLPAEQRRTLLAASKAGSIFPDAIKETGQLYGVNITGIRFPFRSAFFGFSRFGLDRIAGPASFSVLFIYTAAFPEEPVRAQFEKQLAQGLLANYIVYFIYGGG
jgi:hypothetical protein